MTDDEIYKEKDRLARYLSTWGTTMVRCSDGIRGIHGTGDSIAVGSLIMGKYEVLEVLEFIGPHLSYEELMGESLRP